MNNEKVILVVGTFDTKSPELAYLVQRIQSQGAFALCMDVSVLGEPAMSVEISKHEVAHAADSSIAEVIDAGDENAAMQIMARGASNLCRDLYRANRIDAMIALGGTMGTDLALDCASALPLGVPKVIVSTVAFSPLITCDRLAADIQMILWAGGLYGLNSVCKSSLSQAAGAVVGAARAVEPPDRTRPLVGITSLGTSVLSYVQILLPALEKRGFEVAVFHSTGMGGRAFESLAEQNEFVCVMDFCLQEFTNAVHGSVVNSGADRLSNAGKAGIPQIVAPGASDLVDLQAWLPVPEKWAKRPYHAHNRLIASVAVSGEERRQTARAIGLALSRASAPVHFLMPLQGIEEWDREGAPAHDPIGLSAFVDEMRSAINDPVEFTELDAHINDSVFCDLALRIFDDWLDKGVIKR